MCVSGTLRRVLMDYPLVSALGQISMGDVGQMMSWLAVRCLWLRGVRCL